MATVAIIYKNNMLVEENAYGICLNMWRVIVTDKLVSCIITTYKRPAYILKRAIDSVISQTYESKELIVVNDYPEDERLSEELGELVESYTDCIKVKYIVHEKNMGGCIARNTGIDNSCGSYVAFLDDDDEWLPNKLEMMVSCFSKNVGLVYSDYIVRSERGDTVYEVPNYKSDWFEHLLGKNYVGSASFPILDRDILIKAGKFDSEMPSMQDWDMWLRIAQLSTFVYCQGVLTIYHVQQESVTTNMGNKKIGRTRIMEKYEEFYRANKKECSLYYDTAAIDFLNYNQIGDGLSYLLKAVVTYPLLSRHAEVFKHALSKIRKRIVKK